MTTADIWRLAACRLPEGWSCAIELPGHVIMSRGSREIGHLTVTRSGDLEAVAFSEPDPLDHPSRWFFSHDGDEQAFDDAVAWLASCA
ncbi:MAG: hypothetical protein JWN41_520 [Thermoleophilia bacterium]|nr:hypothetical protein [Thermoleophilia bacterium]